MIAFKLYICIYSHIKTSYLGGLRDHDVVHPLMCSMQLKAGWYLVGSLNV